MRKSRDRRLSPASLEILQAIIEYKLDCDGNSPSGPELAEATNYHLQTVKRHLYALEYAGKITLVGPRQIIVHDALWLAPEFAQKHCATCPYFQRQE